MAASKRAGSKPGPKPKDPGEVRRHRLVLWLNDEQKAMVDAAAKMDFDEPSNYARRVVLFHSKKRLKEDGADPLEADNAGAGAGK